MVNNYLAIARPTREAGSPQGRLARHELAPVDLTPTNKRRALARRQRPPELQINPGPIPPAS